MTIKERKMCSIFSILSAQCYFCLIKYTRNQFNTKVYPTGKKTFPRRTISGVMDNITVLCESSSSPEVQNQVSINQHLSLPRALMEQLTNWYESLCIMSILSQAMLVRHSEHPLQRLHCLWQQ